MKFILKYAKRYWKGDLSQAQAFWVTLVPALVIIKSSAALLALFNIIQSPVISTRIWLPLTTVIVLFFIPALFSGSLRAISIHKKLFKGGYSSGWLIAAWVFVAYLTVGQIIKNTPYLMNMAAIASLQEDNNLSISVASTDSSLLLLEGQFEYGTTSKVKSWLDKNLDIKTINLTIDAGHLHEARSLAKLIIKRKLNTQVTDRCAASCMLVLVAGVERSITPNALLQFHRIQNYRNGYRSEWLITREQEADRQYYVRRGVKESFSFPIFYKQTDDQYFEPSAETLFYEGVITKILLSD